MKKILCGIAVSVALSGALCAEESGAFVGVGVGYGGGQMKNSFGGESNKYNFGGVSYGFVGGYKQFFTPYLGLRYYANIDIVHNTLKISGGEDGDTKSKFNLINYGANVDFLGNFISNEALDFGGFIGLGLGANTWSGSKLKELNGKSSKTGFDFALNVGLRVNIAQNHGVEVAARVPFIATTMAKGEGFKQTMQNTYRAIARYTFSF